MNKKYRTYLAIHMIVMLTITLLGTVIQFACIGSIMPIWHWKYSAIEAYTCVTLLWMMLPWEYVSMADTLRELQELDEALETSE